MKKTLIKLTESDIHNIVMKSVMKAINEDYDHAYDDDDEYESDGDKPEWFDSLNKIVTSEGWPALSIDDDGSIKSKDEDTVITFGIDEEEGTPYISEIHCKFINSDPAYIRDLNGLVSLFQKMWNSRYGLE